MRAHKMMLCGWVVWLLTSCGIGSATPGPTSASTTLPGQGTGNPNGTDPNISIVTHASRYALVGRFDQSDPNGLVFALPNSKIGFAFTGTSLTLNMNELNANGNDMFNVNIDGNTTVIAVNGNVSLPVGRNLQNANHTVWVQKRTEFLQGQAGYVQFFPPTIDANATFLPAPAISSRRMEFIGDSSFTGFGVTQLVSATGANNCDYSVQTQDANESVPADTAALLSAELINVSSSGQSVYDSYYDPNPNHLLPVMEQETVPPNPKPLWSVEDFAPQVIVISAGGDDLWGPAGTGHFPALDNNTVSDPNAFVDAYAAWLAHLRTTNPSALIVCVLSPAASGNDIVTFTTGLQNAIAREVALGDTRVTFYSYFQNDSTYHDYDEVAPLYGYGCKGHPSAAGSMFLAQRLSAFIQTEMTALHLSW